MTAALIVGSWIILTYLLGHAVETVREWWMIRKRRNGMNRAWTPGKDGR